MQCPKCGTDIPEGKLYCPSCGYAVQIVPDYDADLEENLKDVGSDIAGSVNRIDVEENGKTEYDKDASTREIPMVKKEEVPEIVRQQAIKNEFRERVITIAIAGIFSLVLIYIAIVASKSMSSGSFVPLDAVDKTVSGALAAGIETDNDPLRNTVDVELPEDTVSGNEAADEEEEETPEVKEALSITPESGKYTKPENIKVQVNGAGEADFTGVIYYTTDGSEPDEESKVYKNELPMPVGKSLYSFRLLDSAGNLGESVLMEYDLQYAGACSTVDAANLIIATLINHGALIDIYGHVPGSLGAYTYKCSSMINADGRTYFLIPESYEEPGGRKKVTGTIYAIDAETLQPFKANKSGDGRYSFEAF